MLGRGTDDPGRGRGHPQQKPGSGDHHQDADDNRPGNLAIIQRDHDDKAEKRQQRPAGWSILPTVTKVAGGRPRSRHF